MLYINTRSVNRGGVELQEYVFSSVSFMICVVLGVFRFVLDFTDIQSLLYRFHECQVRLLNNLLVL